MRADNTRLDNGKPIRFQMGLLIITPAKIAIICLKMLMKPDLFLFLWMYSFQMVV